MGRNHLGQFEQLVLFALLRLGENPYGMTIRREIESRTRSTTALGAVYTTLSRLEQKGFVFSWTGEPTPERGGRAKRFFKITALGQTALREAQFRQTAMADGLQPSWEGR